MVMKMKNRRMIVLFCLLGLAVLAFAGYIAHKPEVSVDPARSAETQEPENTGFEPMPVYGEEKDFVITIGGIEETVTMTYTELDFSGLAEPAKVALYTDRTRYNGYSYEGEYYIVPIGSGEEPKCWLHIFPKTGETAQEVFEETKNTHKDSIVSEGVMELDNDSVLYFTISTGSIYYFADYSGGCVFIDLTIEPETAEEHAIRLAAMAKTIKVIE